MIVPFKRNLHMPHALWTVCLPIGFKLYTCVQSLYKFCNTVLEWLCNLYKSWQTACISRLFNCHFKMMSIQGYHSPIKKEELCMFPRTLFWRGQWSNLNNIKANRAVSDFSLAPIQEFPDMLTVVFTLHWKMAISLFVYKIHFTKCSNLYLMCICK